MVHQHLRCQGRAFNNYVDNKRREGAAESPQGVSRMSTGDQKSVNLQFNTVGRQYDRPAA